MNDHYSIRANRPLVFGVQSGVTYGVETTKMSASMSRQVIKNLSAEVAQHRRRVHARVLSLEG